MKPTKPALPPDPSAPWFTPGPEKEAWKKLPGNRYTPEELEREAKEWEFGVKILRHPARRYVA